MAKKQLRTRVAALASGVAITALLAGPALTWGLDVAGVSSSTPVSSTVQTVTSTVDQTTSTAVSTVQTTVQTTTAPVVQTTAPVVQQVQSTVAPAPTAPATTSAPAPTRTSAPATTVRSAPTRTASAPKTATQHVAAAVRGAARALQTTSATTQVTSAAASTTAAVRAAGTKVQHSLRTARPASSTKPASTRAALLPCDRLVTLLPLGGTIQGLVALLCDTGNLAFPARSGPTTNASPTPVATLVHVLVAATGQVETLHARAAGVDRKRFQLGTRGQAPRSSAAVPARDLVAGAHGAGFSGHAGAPASAAAGAGSATVAATAAATGTATGAVRDLPPTMGNHNGGGLFGTHLSGTNAVSLVLIVDMALLAALLMWGAARRWVLPRFV